MRISFAIVVTGIMSSCALAQDAPAPAPTPAAPAVQPAPTAESIALAREVMNKILAVANERAAIMVSVKDKASADAAAPKFHNSDIKLAELKYVDAPRPTKELVEEYIPKLQEARQTTLDELERIKAAEYFGSEELKNVLGPKGDVK